MMLPNLTPTVDDEPIQTNEEHAVYLATVTAGRPGKPTTDHLRYERDWEPSTTDRSWWAAETAVSETGPTDEDWDDYARHREWEDRITAMYDPANREWRI